MGDLHETEGKLLIKQVLYQHSYKKYYIYLPYFEKASKNTNNKDSFKKHHHYSKKAVKPQIYPAKIVKMVCILKFGLLLIASALTAQACTYCQCEFADSSHCCVYSVMMSQVTKEPN
jgi:hypothetical protein